MSGAPKWASSCANSFATSAGLLASQAKACARASRSSGARSEVVRAASATLIPSPASARASEAERPAPAPTIRAVASLVSKGAVAMAGLSWLACRDGGRLPRRKRGRRMTRYLIVLAMVVLGVALFWPYLKKLGFGRLPGDIVIKR